MGQLKMSNGDIYIGEFYNDEFHGQVNNIISLIIWLGVTKI